MRRRKRSSHESLGGNMGLHFFARVEPEKSSGSARFFCSQRICLRTGTADGQTGGGGTFFGTAGENRNDHTTQYRQQTSGGHRHAGGSSRQSGLVQGAGGGGSRGWEADADRRHVPDLLDDQAHYQRGRHDAL